MDRHFVYECDGTEKPYLVKIYMRQDDQIDNVFMASLLVDFVTQ